MAATVYLVRHAQALGRTDWAQPDELRPLSPKGERQARGLAGLLGGEPIERVLSSPAVRCQLTVKPLAEKLGLDVEVVDLLNEGNSAETVIPFMKSVAKEVRVSVMCSHGDVIPDVIRHLTAKGMKLHDPLKWAKGSVWAVEYEHGEFTSARYLPPTA